MAKKSGWVDPKNPIYGKGGVVDSVLGVLPNAVGGITDAMGIGKKGASPKRGPKAPAKPSQSMTPTPKKSVLPELKARQNALNKRVKAQTNSLMMKKAAK